LFENINIERVLIAPLDWGLGHATRCIPIIKALQELGKTVLLAGDGPSAQLLQTEFPSLTLLPLRGYHISYAKTGWGLPWQMLAQAPAIFQTIKDEHAWLDAMIEEQQIDLVISDNRYGLYSKKIPCVLITHQLTIKMPFAWLERHVQKIHYSLINRFHTCWVPDSKGTLNLGGDLSHTMKMPAIPVKWIGLLSRFAPSKSAQTEVQTNNDPTPSFAYQYCFLLSGPEPQRTLLENNILKNTEGLKEPMVLVRGLPSSQNISTDTSKHTEKPISPNPLPASLPQQLTVYNHLPAADLAPLILSSEWIICRSGYSTLMDLAALRKNAILIPTPGQTEQEYLAKQLLEQGMAFSVAQSKFSLSESIAQAKKLSADARASKELPFFNTNMLQGLLLALESL
jgi:spore coat polysaccharide biosynthesis predicted glycosyltransferase SpsG